MFISNKLVGKYQKMYEQKIGKSISAKEAEHELLDLAELVKLVKHERRNRHGK